MKTTELRALSDAEILVRLNEAREAYFKLRFQFATGQLTDHTRLRRARREIARLATLAGERQQPAAVEGSEA
ncbi:MAG: 50S ribosomal protein L29 [Anaerolineales bacterium]|jgi:large subunit ribosomal protein L29|nr:50S ribosomal protein L29 [Anaerolineales bacterium]